MRSLATRCRQAAGLAALLIASLASAASAAGLEVNPLSITTASYADITVINTGGDLMRVAVNAFTWAQDPDTPQRVDETQQLAYFPKVFNLAPGASQRIRVGVTLAPGADERAYRLFITELPPLANAVASGPRLTVLTRVDLPVFQPPAAGAGTPDAHITGLVWRSGQGVRVGLTNTGTGHVPPGPVALTAHGADGRVLWSGTQTQWYVLPHALRSADFAVPEQTCAAIRSFDVRWSAGGRTVSASLPNGPCR